MNVSSLARPLAALAMSTGLAACGAGSSSTSSSGTSSGTSSVRGTAPPALSRSEFVARAGAICAKFKAQEAAIPKPRTVFSDPVAAATYADQDVSVVDRNTNALQALKAPSDVATDWQAFVHALVAFDHALQKYKDHVDANAKHPLPRQAELAVTVDFLKNVSLTLARLSGTAGKIGFMCTV